VISAASVLAPSKPSGPTWLLRSVSRLRVEDSTPGIAFLPDSHLLFIGAGTRLLAYDLERAARL
jgi:hypothetical protein